MSPEPTADRESLQVVTNSDVDFANFVMHVSFGADWRKLFDFVGFFARKGRGFFEADAKDSPFLTLPHFPDPGDLPLGSAVNSRGLPLNVRGPPAPAVRSHPPPPATHARRHVSAHTHTRVHTHTQMYAHTSVHTHTHTRCWHRNVRGRCGVAEQYSQVPCARPKHSRVPSWIDAYLSCLSRWHATAAMPRDTVCCSGMMCSGVPPTGAMQRTAHTHSHACACVLSRMQKHTGASTLATT